MWDRAVTLLPRVDQLWYKYIHMEEMLGNVPAARQIFERWMQWEPDHHGWAAYVKVTHCTVPWFCSQCCACAFEDPVLRPSKVAAELASASTSLF